MVTSAALEVAQQRRIPFVTMQHGAVNILYAPFRADQYWVWSDDDAEALRALQPERAASVRVVRRETDGEPAPLPARDDARRLLKLPAAGRIVLMYSQTHGAEFSGATHFAIAAQLAEVLRQAPDTSLLIKRHPSESRSAYESLQRCFGAERVMVAPPGLSASVCARAADVACAISSTALREATAAGCPAIEVLSPESLVRHPVAATRVEPQHWRRRCSWRCRRRRRARCRRAQPHSSPADERAPTLAEALTACCSDAADA